MYIRNVYNDNFNGNYVIGEKRRLINIEKISQWALTLSGVSIVSGILLILLPQNSHKKMFRAIITVIMIYAALQPFVGTNAFDFNISDFIKDNYEISEDIDKYALSGMLRSAEKAIEDILCEQAQAQNIKADFRCKCEENDGEIAVKDIYVSGNYNDDSKADIENIIISLGFDKSIIIFEGDIDEHG
jgi:hypothetical protein